MFNLDNFHRLFKQQNVDDKKQRELTAGHPNLAAKRPPRGKMMHVPAGAPDTWADTSWDRSRGGAHTDQAACMQGKATP